VKLFLGAEGFGREDCARERERKRERGEEIEEHREVELD